MKTGKIIGCALGAVGLMGSAIGLLEYRLSKGVPVEPAVVADFNQDCVDDIIYVRALGYSGNADGLVFVDGRDLIKRGGVYLRKTTGKPIPQAALFRGKKYLVTEYDFNNRIKGFFVKEMDPDNGWELFLGDGEGNFIRYRK